MFQLDFDPTQLSYGDLLDQIWANRRSGRSYGRQYMEAVFPANAEQERIARERGITVPIIAGAQFWLAEDYHQKYYLRHDSVLMRELAGYTPRQLVDSTVAARMNGYVAGRERATREQIAALGLSAAGTAHLERLVVR